MVPCPMAAPRSPAPGAAEGDAEVARALNAQRPARQEAEDEAEEVKIRLLAMVKDEPEAEDVKIRAVEWVDAGGERKRVKREREVDGAAEAGPSGRGVRSREPWNAGQGTSRSRGVTKLKKARAKPWMAYIKVTEDGKQRHIYIGSFAREEDAARAYDRVSIAKLGHAEAKTNFPVAEYRAEWAQLEALGVDGSVAHEGRHAKRL